MFAIGNDELKEPLGNDIKCKHCGEFHAIEYGEEVMSDGTRKPSKLLAFYKCSDKSYLSGINGFAI